jgi:hypothetical protein
MSRQHARIAQHPFAISLQGGLLDLYVAEQRGEQLHITLSIRTFEKLASELLERGGIVYERVKGNYAPIKLHFSGASGLISNPFFMNIKSLSLNDPARTINDFLSWQQIGKREIFYLLGMHARDVDHLMFFAQQVIYERLSDNVIPISFERDWCPPPPMPGRLVPNPKQLHAKFGGDPITVHLGTRAYHHRLFIGGIDIQPMERPQVDAVFNVGETASKWAQEEQNYAEDRWKNKGEGADGMSLEIIREAATWIIERLKKNQRVLVHCVAGMNRSSTICCAALILLEGLTAKQALERVRERHPWARPDSNHWLKLRWLAKHS